MASVFSGDVVLGFHTGMVLWFRGLGSGEFVALPVLFATVASWFTICMAVGAGGPVTDIILGEVRRRRGGGGGGTVLPHLVHTENLGHVVDDENFGPLGNWFGLSTTEVDVHNENGERCGGCDHGHGGNIVLACVTDRDVHNQEVQFILRIVFQNSEPYSYKVFNLGPLKPI